MSFFAFGKGRIRKAVTVFGPVFFCLPLAPLGTPAARAEEIGEAVTEAVVGETVRLAEVEAETPAETVGMS